MINWRKYLKLQTKHKHVQENQFILCLRKKKERISKYDEKYSLQPETYNGMLLYNFTTKTLKTHHTASEPTHQPSNQNKSC